MMPLRGARQSSQSSRRRSSSDAFVGKAAGVSRGISDGLSSFSRALLLEAIRVGVGIASGAQVRF